MDTSGIFIESPVRYSSFILTLPLAPIRLLRLSLFLLIHLWRLLLLLMLLLLLLFMLLLL